MQLGKLYGAGFFNMSTPNKFKIDNKSNYQSVSFGSSIPTKEIHDLSDIFLKKSESVISEVSFFQMADEFFKTHLLNLVKGTPEDMKSPGNLLRLFRHELINNVMSKFELNMNPDFKEFVEEENAHIKNFSYPKHQKNIFKELVATVKDMVNLWGKIENWKNDKNKEVTFKEMISTLQSAAKYGNSIGASIEFENNLDAENLVTKNAFEQYNILSQIILNSLKYSEGKPVTVQFTKTPSHQAFGENIYTMIAENHGTKPIRNEDIDKILEGNGHRSNDRNIQGTGVGYAEIIDILRRNYQNEKNLNLIEKNRKSGVKVIVPFKLEKK